MTLQERYAQCWPLGYLSMLGEDGIPTFCPDETDYTGPVGARCAERCPAWRASATRSSCAPSGDGRDEFSSCAECWQQEYEEGGEEDAKKDTG